MPFWPWRNVSGAVAIVSPRSRPRVSSRSPSSSARTGNVAPGSIAGACPGAGDAVKAGKGLWRILEARLVELAFEALDLGEERVLALQRPEAQRRGHQPGAGTALQVVA